MRHVSSILLTSMATAVERASILVDSLNEQFNLLLSSASSSTVRLTITTLALGSATYAIYKHIIYPLYFSPLSKFPGPSTSWVPFAGNFLEIMRLETSAPHLKWTAQYGPVIRYYGLFNEPRLLVTDPELLKDILVTRSYEFIKSPKLTKNIGRMFGFGILLAEVLRVLNGDDHKHQRKLINPAFSHSNIKLLVPTFFAPARALLNQWQIELIGESTSEVDVLEGMTAATLDIIGKAGFGYDFGATNPDEDEVNPLNRAYTAIFSPQPTITRILSMIVPGWKFLPLPSNFTMYKSLKVIRSTTQELVDTAKAKTVESKKNISVTEKGGTRDLLSILIEARDENGNGMSDSLLKAQIMTFLAAGHETTSVAATWALHLLAQKPEFQDRLREEIKPLFARVAASDENDLPTYDEIDSLKYLNAVVKETLRLIPPAPMMNRFTTSDTTIGGYFVPKETPIFISPGVTQRQQSVWGDDSLEFNPDRWFHEPAASISPYVYMPFFAGPRSCIGYKFALMEMKVLLGTLIATLVFKEKPRWVVRKKQGLTWRPSPTVRLIIERADKGIAISEL